jgi:DNA replication and repair protein RecF
MEGHAVPGLAITSLTLSRFRSHGRTHVESGGRPVVLYGPNGAGKTNILEALSLLSPGRGLRRAGAEELAQAPGDVGWKVTAVARSGADLFEVETWAEPGQPRQVRIDGKAAPQAALARVLRMVWLVPSMDRLWTEGAEGRRRFLDRITMSFDPSHAEAVLAYEKAMRERNRLLKDMVRDSHWYQALERQMAEAGETIRLARRAALARLAAAQAGAETAFPAADLSVVSEEPVPEGADALAVAFAEGRPADMRAGRTLVGPHRIDLHGVYATKGVPAGLCSTGEQKALLISLILANSRAIAEDRGAAPVVLLDEVAAHLDADRRAALYDEIAALGAQAWMTGTGPELFAEMGERALRIEVREEAGVSRIEVQP